MTTTDAPLPAAAVADPGARYDMGECNPVADMIEAAAKKLGATVFWFKHRRGSHVGAVKLADGEVAVEACLPKYGARIESEDTGRHREYQDAGKLADAIKSRVKRMKATDERQEREWAAQRERERQEVAAAKAGREELVAAHGETIVEACAYVTARTSRDEGGNWRPPRVTVNVHCDKIRGVNLTVAEASRFIQTLRTGGYDLVAINDESERRALGGK